MAWTLDNGHIPTTWRWSWVYTSNTAHVRGLGEKRVKILKLKESYRAKLLAPFDSSRRADLFNVFGYQNRLKNGRVMPIQSLGKSGFLAYFGLKVGYFGHIYWDMDFKCVLSVIYINIEGQIQLEVNWTQIDHAGLQKATKWPYLKTSFSPSVNHQNPYSSYIDSEIFRQIHWKM